MTGVVGRPTRMSRSGREALLDVRKWSGGSPGCLGVVGRPPPDVHEWSEDATGCPGVVEYHYRMFGIGQETLPNGREWLRGSPKYARVVRRPSRKFGSVREAHSNVRETLPNFREWSRGPPEGAEWSANLSKCPGGPPGCLGLVGRPSRMSKSDRETLPDVWEWSGHPPKCPGEVGRPSRMFLSGRLALPDVREWSGVPPRCL